MSRQVGANDPCPCGSGQKYKKCCRDLASKKQVQPPMQTSMQTFIPPLPDLMNPLIQENPLPHLRSWLDEATQSIEQYAGDIHKISGSEVALVSEVTSSLRNQVMATLKIHQGQKQASSPHSPNSGTPITAWIPLAETLPHRYIRYDEQKHVLPHPLQQFLLDVTQLLEQKTTESVAEAWQRLQTIPPHEAARLPWVLNARHTALLLMQREQEFYDELMEILCTWPDEELWMAYGHYCLPWLENHIHNPEVCRHFLQRLADLSHHSQFIPIRLVLGRGWHRLREHEHDAYRWLQESVQPNHWPWHSAPLHPRKTPSLLQQYAANWLPLLVDSILGLLIVAHDNNNLQEIENLSGLFFQFPWEFCQPEYRFTLFDSICRSFAALGRFHDVQKFCEHNPHRIFPRPLRLYWLGRSLEMQKQPQQAHTFYEKARENPRDLHDVALGDMINFYGQRNELHLCFELFEAFQDKNSPDYLRARCCYELNTKHIDTALTLADRFLSVHPDDHEMLLQRLRMLEHLDRIEEFRRDATKLLQHPTARVQQTAHAILAIHYYCSELFHEAQQHFDVLPNDVSQDIFFGDLYFAHNYFACRSAIQQQQGHITESLASLFKAKEILPLPSVYRQILLIACQQGDFDLIAQSLAEAETVDRDHFFTHFARMCLLWHQKQWHECQQWLQQYTLEDFQAYGLTTAWIQFKLYTLAHNESTIAAFHFAEQHIDIVLQEQEMREFRKQLWKDVFATYTTMSTELGRQAQQLEQTQKQWQQQQGKEQKINKNLQKVLQHQEAELQRLRSLQYEKSNHSQVEKQELATFRQQYPWIESLEAYEQTMVEEAELFWLHARAQGVQDYSPVVLQLSRVVESILNRWLIDPLVAWGRSQGATLQDFPSTSVQPLRPTQNRLSLGETTRLLFHELRIREKDGSVSIQKNSQSTPIHRDILYSFWQQLPNVSPSQRQYLSESLILDLQVVTRWRNRASHAGDPIPQPQAERVRSIILGSQPSPGMIASILSCRPDTKLS